MLSIVGIVAGIVVFVGLMNLSGSDDIFGAAIAEVQTTAPGLTEWTACLDNGNVIKLMNEDGGVLMKKDICTGSAVSGKQIVRVFCAQNVNGGFTYKSSNAEDCPEGTACKKDENGAAYCS